VKYCKLIGDYVLIKNGAGQRQDRQVYLDKVAGERRYF